MYAYNADAPCMNNINKRQLKFTEALFLPGTELSISFLLHILLFNFSITVYIHYSVLISDAHHSG